MPLPQWLTDRATKSGLDRQVFFAGERMPVQMQFTVIRITQKW